VDSGAHRRARRGGDGGRRAAAQCGARAMRGRERCVGRRESLMACMQARWRGRLGPGEGGAARGRGDGARAGLRARGRGPDHDGRRVVLAVTAYGRQAGVGPARCVGVAPRGDVARVGRAPAFQPTHVSLHPTLIVSNSKTLN
jgi:hypothetical protein